MLQKIPREQVLELLGTLTGDLLASGWTPMVCWPPWAPRGAGLCVQALETVSARQRRPAVSRPAPKTLRARE